MNYIDIIILIILGFSLFRGFKNGLVIEIASLAALVFGIWGAIKFSSFTANKLYEYFDMTGQYIGIISFIITFIIIVIVIVVFSFHSSFLSSSTQSTGAMLTFPVLLAGAKPD